MSHIGFCVSGYLVKGETNVSAGKEGHIKAQVSRGALRLSLTSICARLLCCALSTG